MTVALCFNCGETKFGALCQCDKCEADPTGDSNIDIAFSDHNYSVGTLEQFGSVIKEIRAHCDDPATCFCAFGYYVSKYHPGILNVELEPGMAQELEAVLAKCTLPAVLVQRSEE